MNKIEIMAPAGSLETLKVAVDCGADAVYLGIGAYNARMNAENFTIDTLIEGCKYAHLRSSKVYLTLNTIVNDFEFDDAVSTAVEAYSAGVDGIIIQDIGLASKILEDNPEIPLICSTQMNVFSADEITSLANMGFKRIVLPRELSLSEISKRTRIAKNLNVETEVFVHGAVCVSCSGLCLFSSMNKSGSRSGNRGLCAQPCRQEYELYAEKTKIKEGHLISPKDRCLIPFLSSIIEAGVSSIKIEGRMRDANYVASATRAYRKLVDAYYEGTLTKELEDSVYNDLLVSFNRGGSFTSQFMSGKKDPNFLSGDYVGKFGLKLGNLTSRDPKKGTITFTYSEDLPLPTKGDYLSIRLGSLELCSFPIGKVHEAPKSLSVKGLHPEMIEKLPESKAQVYLMSHDYSITRDELRKTHVNLSIDVKDDLLTIDARVNSGINIETSAYFDIDLPTDFEGSALDHDRISAQLRKTGDTPFVVDEIYYCSDEPIKCRISQINELRRGLFDALSSEIDYSYERNVMTNSFDMFGDDDVEMLSSEEEGCNSTLHIFPSYKRIGDDLDRSSDMYGFSFYDLSVNGFANKICEFINSVDAKLVVVMPDFYHDRLEETVDGVFEKISSLIGDKFYAVIDSKSFTNSDIYEKYSLKHFLSAGSNIYNTKSLEAVANGCDGAYMSYELSPDEVITMLGKSINKVSDDFEILVHSEGLIPWMQSHFCSIGAHKDGCRSCYDPVTYRLKGDSDKECIVISRPNDCSSVIYGESKFTYDEDFVSRINDLGFNTITVSVEI